MIFTMNTADVLIIQNIPREKPGLLADILRQASVAYDVCDLDAGDALPKSGADYKAVVVMGGPDSANDDTPKMQAEIAFVRNTIDRGIPYLGICLGLQVGVKAAGGSVVPGDVKEVGFLDADGQQNSVELTEIGKASPLFEGMAERFNVFQLHGETVELTPVMQVLAEGKHCRNQVVQIANKAYGIQSHFELTPDMLREWAAADPDLKPFKLQELLNDFRSVQGEYVQVAQKLFDNFLRIAGLVA